MLRALCLSTAIYALASGHASANAPSELDANAALKYWQAFAAIPKFTDAEQTKLMAEYLTMPLDAQARESVSKADYALRMMHQAAPLAQCDWGIDWEAGGIEVLLPQMSAARVLSSLACLRARMRFEEGRRAEALDDVIAATRMGRQVSRDGSLIGVLVGYSIEGRMNDALALFLPNLDPGTIKDLKTRLDALPEGGNPTTGLRVCEEKTLNWFIHKVESAKDTESLIAVLTPIAYLAAIPEGGKAIPPIGGRAVLDQFGGSASAVLKFAQAARPSYASMAEKMALSLGEFEKEFERETMRQAGNPVFKVFFPAVAKVRHSQARAEVRRALFSAAIAVQLDGPDALKTHPDPVVGGPFDYTKFAGGFDLRSKFGEAGPPVVLTAGRRQVGP
jgi:hypothetical protein